MGFKQFQVSSGNGQETKKFSGKFRCSFKFDSLWKTIVEFGENTSFHGVKYIVSENSTTFEKILWLLIVLAGMGGSIYMTLLFWGRYDSNPIRTTILSSHKPTTSVPFPGVTICSAIRILPKKLDDLLRRSNIPATSTREKVAEAFPYLLGYTQPIQVNQSYINTLEAFFKINDLNSLEQVFAQIEPTCEDMLLVCKWKSAIYPCKELFVKSFTLDGACCSLNLTSNHDPFKNTRAFYYGYQVGLTVMLESVFGAYDSSKIVSSLQSVGAKVLIHDLREYPGLSSIEKNIGNGTESFIRMQGTRLDSSSEVFSMPIEQRECLFTEEQSLRYFRGGYRDSNCELECRMDKIYAACKCLPYNYPKVPFRRICNASDIPCLTTFYPAFYKHPPKLNGLLQISPQARALRNLPPCECLPQCDDLFYSIQTTGVPLRNIPYTINLFYDQALEGSDDTSRSSKMVVHVFFGNHAQIVMLKDRITSTYYLLSSFGGVFSLFLGCSFVSVLEIIYFFCFRIFVNCKRP